MTDYEALAKQAESLGGAERDFVPFLSNVSALIWGAMDDINWAGFYLMDNGSLLLGPFQGKVACIRIKVGRGVCGTAVKEERTVLVPDVHAFPGHIACDETSRSEVVVPIRKDGRIVGVLDVDSPIAGRFTPDDAAGLEKVVGVIERLCDFSRLRI